MSVIVGYLLVIAGFIGGYFTAVLMYAAKDGDRNND